jgi:hypothetical protein
MRRSDWIGGAVVAIALAALMAYRAEFIEPRAWGAACAAAAPPLACLPRAGLLWLQQYGLWGLGGLALGLWAFLGGPFAAAVGAVALGAAGVVNYNASFGLLGAALGAWAWLRSDRAHRGATAKA